MKKGALSSPVLSKLPFSRPTLSRPIHTTDHTLGHIGTHLILDFWKAKHLDNLKLIEAALGKCVKVSGATLLDIHLHHFTPNHGVTGVAILAESHISIHTWPEKEYAAVDIFMCGRTQPEKCIEILSKAFETDDVTIHEQLRGIR